MHKALSWIGRHLSFGGLIRDLGSGFGLMIQLFMQGFGFVITLFVCNPQEKQTVIANYTTIGKSINTILTNGSAMVGGAINYGFQACSSTVGFVTAGIAKINGISEENTILARKLGTALGAITLGIVAGAGIADAAVAVAATAGTVGGAATTSGLAALGGGSIATGGGGMAVGQVVTQSIVAVGGAFGVATLTDKYTVGT